ncbi:helix-turn-helix transcriptional regulator [Fusibacter ferrireducens]|uniref:Helix-turn-helix transcriptional regulator n=1 Tax=Fusibacter ferrireducens TaxID=2785058 RepID=A0ABR9ZXP9_9FIRM|nr:response regulator transcription factor [Fusibacter ferrireducens]MBF4694635.1 helix-turn-helix transcriptional regulator [Fusibacter ferrireducens]
MHQIKNIKNYPANLEQNPEYIVEMLKKKYNKLTVHNRKTHTNYIRFPYEYFSDLKFFLERENPLAVQTLLNIAGEVTVEKIVGKSELREFKNALIVFMTLFVNVMIEVYGDRDNQTIAFSRLISKLEDIDDYEKMKRMVLDEMSNMIRKQSIVKTSVSHSMLVQNALKMIQGQFRKQMRLKSLAQELSVSESYLSRCLKRETGMTLSEHILKLRIDEAKQLLIKTDASVYDIATAVGFNYQNHFASVFKKYTGLQPLVYRNRHFR